MGMLNALARPKSAIFNSSLVPINIFYGFKSLWMMRLLWQAAMPLSSCHMYNFINF